MKSVMMTTVFTGVAALALMGGAGVTQPKARDGRQYQTGPLVLSAGTYGAATLERAEGGFAIAGGDEGGAKESRRQSPVRVVPLRAGVSPDDFRDWVAEFCAGNDKTVTGILAMGDAEKNAATTRRFEDASLAGFELGELDGASKDSATMTLEIRAREVHWGKGDGPAANAPGAKQKRAMAANFSLEIDALPTARVARVEPISARREAEPESGGLSRRRDAGRPVASDLVFSLSAADIEPYLKWLEESLYQGKGDRRTATVTLLDPGLKNAVFQLRATGLAIRSVEPEVAKPEAERAARFTVRCSVERWDVPPGKKQP